MQPHQTCEWKRKGLPRTVSPPLPPPPPPFPLLQPQERAQSKERQEVPSFTLPDPPPAGGTLAKDPALDINTSRQSLLIQIRQGVSLKPVSSHVGSESDPEFLRERSE